MTRVVPDSNILFAGLRTTHSRARRLLLTRTDLQFFTPNFLVAELFDHGRRLREGSSLTEAEFKELFGLLVQRLHFVHEDDLQTGNLIHAHHLCHDIDPKDTLFVALSLELDAKLWTRDELLKSGLMKKGFRNFFDEEAGL